jgi:hypothetical protein
VSVQTGEVQAAVDESEKVAAQVITRVEETTTAPGLGVTAMDTSVGALPANSTPPIAGGLGRVAA